MNARRPTAARRTTWMGSICALVCVVGFSGAPSRAQDGGAGRPARSTSALSDILSLPPNDVVPALVRALQNESMFQHPDWKHRGYSVLLSINGVGSMSGIRQFARGLDDPVVSCLCVYALGTAPPENRALAVNALNKYLDRMLAGQPVACSDTGAVFEAVGNLGRSAESLGPRMEGVIADPTRPVSLRGQAAKTLARVAGMVHYIEFTDKLIAADSVGSRLLLNALLLEGEDTRWSALPASSQARKAFLAMLQNLLHVRPQRNYLERVQLGNDAPEVLAETALLKERIDLGSLLVESIGRHQPRYAGDPMMTWITELRGLVALDPVMSVRLAARTKLVRAEQRMAYFGTQ